MSIVADLPAKGRGRQHATPRVTTIADMPRYPQEMHQIVDAMLADMTSSPALVTYRGIREQFGISRATVARRLKDGVVPGITLVDGRVLDDGPVRRFDRMQLRWLLLAVRFSNHRV